jgi:hypothetical protein
MDELPSARVCSGSSASRVGARVAAHLRHGLRRAAPLALRLSTVSLAIFAILYLVSRMWQVTQRKYDGLEKPTYVQYDLLHPSQLEERLKAGDYAFGAPSLSITRPAVWPSYPPSALSHPQPRR